VTGMKDVWWDATKLVIKLGSEVPPVRGGQEKEAWELPRPLV